MWVTGGDGPDNKPGSFSGGARCAQSRRASQDRRSQISITTSDVKEKRAGENLRPQLGNIPEKQTNIKITPKETCYPNRKSVLRHLM